MTPCSGDSRHENGPTARCHHSALSAALAMVDLDVISVEAYCGRSGIEASAAGPRQSDEECADRPSAPFGFGDRMDWAHWRHPTGAVRGATSEPTWPDPWLSEWQHALVARSSYLARRFGLSVRAGAAVLAVLFVVDTIALTHLLVQDRSRVVAPTKVAPNPPEINAAVAWAGRELAHSVKILTNPTMRTALTARGFTNVLTATALAGGTAPTRVTFDYAVSTPALRAAARSGDPVKRALNVSVPIAVFGSGRHQVVVRQVSTVSPAEVASRQAADLRRRRAGERQLLTNPAIRARPPALTALRAGQLDLRAATVIVLMANSSHVEIVSVHADEPERAAGLPARSVDVRTDADAAVEALLSNLPSSYRPTSDTRLPDGTHRMVWPIDPEPPTGLN
jgi:hypothetical protein